MEVGEQVAARDTGPGAGSAEQLSLPGFRPMVRATSVLTVALAGWILVALAHLAAGVHLLWILRASAAGPLPDLIRALPIAHPFVTTTPHMAMLTSLAAVIGVFWSCRASGNQWALKTIPDHPTGMCAIAWIVPGFNLFLPYRVTGEVVRNSARAAAGEGTRHRYPAALMRAWWAAVLLTSLSWSASASLAMPVPDRGPEPVEMLSPAVGAALAGHLCGIAAASLAIVLTRRVAAWQKTGAERLAALRAADELTRQAWLAGRRQDG